MAIYPSHALVRLTGFIFGFFVLSFVFAADADAQRRDYMTEAEIELVRDAQEIDKRIDVLTKMIDRRLAVAGIDASGFVVSKKDETKWGSAPAGTRLELLNDVRFLLQKSIDDIDDVSHHNADARTESKTDGLLFPKAVRLLEAAAKRYQKSLQPLVERSSDEKERGIIVASLAMCEEIIEAAANIPADKVKKKN